MEITITKDDLRTYIDTLDLKNNNIARIVSNLQLLSPDILMKVFSALISRQMDITRLVGVPINDRSMSLLLESLEIDNSPSINRYEFYKNVINTSEGYLNHVAEIRANKFERIKNLMIPTYRLSKSIDIDTLGLDKTKYHSIVEVKKKYTEVVNSPIIKEKDAKLRAATLLLQEAPYNFNISRITDNIIESVRDYGLIHTEDNTIPFTYTKNSIVGWIRRGSYEYSIYDNHHINKNIVILKMVEGYDDDVVKLGFNNLLTSYKGMNTWRSLFSDDSIRNNLLPERFEELVNMYYIFLGKVYGSTYISESILNEINSTYLVILQYFRACNTYLEEVASIVYAKV